MKCKAEQGRQDRKRSGCQAFLFFYFQPKIPFSPIFSYFSALIPIFPIFFQILRLSLGMGM